MAPEAIAAHVHSTTGPVDVAEEPRDGLGSLKAILEVIPAIYDNDRVRLQPPTKESP